MQTSNLALKLKKLSKSQLNDLAIEGIKFSAATPASVILDSHVLTKHRSTPSHNSTQAKKTNVTHASKPTEQTLESTTKEVKTAVIQTFTALTELNKLLEKNLDKYGPTKINTDQQNNSTSTDYSSSEADFNKKRHDSFNASFIERFNEFMNALMSGADKITTPSELNSFNGKAMNMLQRLTQTIMGELDNFLVGLPYDTSHSVPSNVTYSSSQAIANLRSKAEEVKAAATQNFAALKDLNKLIDTTVDNEQTAENNDQQPE